MAYLLATHPDTFDAVVDNDIKLFHGTNANALPNILKYGLNSLAESDKKGISVSTGEKSSRTQYGKARNFSSWTDDIDLTLGYSSILPSEECRKNEMSFEIVIGMSKSDVNQMRTCIVDSDVPEIGIKGNVPIENIKFIGVPPNKVEFVSKLVDDKSIIVAPIDTGEKFYYIDIDEMGEIYLNEDMMQEQEKTFNNEEVKELVSGRKKSAIKGIYSKIKNVFDKVFNKEGINNERDS